jgi:uncharacterized cupin superfamily protein
MSRPKIAIHSSKAALGSSPINSAWILEGQPQARARVLQRSSDRLACTVLWECTAGKFEWHYSGDETIYILEGNIVVGDQHTPPRHLGPGDVVFFPNGSVAHWEVENYVRKIAFCHRTLPAFMQMPVALLRRLKGMLRGPAAPGLMDAA